MNAKSSDASVVPDSASTEDLKQEAMITTVEPASFEETDQAFRTALEEPLRESEDLVEASIVIGIPFYNEVETIGRVVRTVREGLERYYPAEKSVIVSVGSPYGAEALRVVNSIPQSKEIRHLSFLLDNERMNGKGWAIWAIMKIALNLNADLAIIEADVERRDKNGDIEGLAPDWVNRLLEPIKTRGMDLVISRFNRSFLEAPISDHLIRPLLTAVYNCPIHDLLGGQLGISYRLIRTYLQEAPHPSTAEIGGYAVDIWLATKAITTGAKICETNLGIKIPGKSGKIDIVLHHVMETLFEQIIADTDWWNKPEIISESILLNDPAVFGSKKAHIPDTIKTIPEEHVTKYKRGFNKFHALYKEVLPEEVYGQLERLNEGDYFYLSSRLWTQIVYHFLLTFAFSKEFAKGDLMNSFIPLYEGLMASDAMAMQKLQRDLKSTVPDMTERLVSLEAHKQTDEMLDEFLSQRPNFVTTWQMKEEVLKPPIPKITYREFIPGVHLVVPLDMKTPEGHIVSANAIYESIFSRYKGEFDHFLHETLAVSQDASSKEVIRQIQDFMHRLERLLDSSLLAGDLSTVEGTQQVVQTIFDNFHHEKVFSVSDKMSLRIISRYPPSILLTTLGYNSLTELLKKYGPNDVLAMASWSEDREYQQQVWSYIREHALPEDFELTEMKPVVVNHEQFPSLVEMRECIGFCKLAGRTVVSNLHKGRGGEYPKLRYFTTLAKSIVEVERFGQIWQGWAEEGRNFGDKIVNSLEGHWGREPLSAHNIFENGHQRVLVQRVKEMAQQLAKTPDEDESRLDLARSLDLMADLYHIALTLPDGTFIPCSAWTWASYSSKGGTGVPTPLSLHVERDWSSSDFLTEYFKASGGKEEAIKEKTVDLMGRGEEWRNLASILLGTAKEADATIMRELISSDYPPAIRLIRYQGNPILEPIKEHPWESKYVLNPGAIRLNGNIYLVYRAVGEDNISRLGLAISKDGFDFSERLDTPIFEPASQYEEKGCEDPRLTVIGDRIFMMYTAYSSLVAQIAMASININDFLKHDWKAWRRHGMVFLDFPNKDGVLFPEQFDGKFAMLHRVDPHIWITFSPHLPCPWSRKEHKILAGSTYGMMWDSKKIGAGTPPINTEFGWLLVIHGVDQHQVYRLGAMLLDPLDPTIVIYRSPNAILEPVEDYETGDSRRHWVPNVVFTCGAITKGQEKQILGADDELIVYYGAADSVICAATSRIRDLIPVIS